MPSDVSAIRDYHAHIYFEPGVTEEAATHLRDRVARAFPSARVGRWHARPVGPHPQAMFQIAFPVDQFPGLVPWLMLNRDGLNVLLHPETGDDLADHTAHAAWFGDKHPLRLEAFASPK